MQIERREAKGERREVEARKRLRLYSTLDLRLFILMPVFAFAVSVLIGAPPPRTKVKGFSVPEYFDPPNETKLKSLLEGAEAEPKPGGKILITGLKLQTFDEQGVRQMLATAPHCVLDTRQQIVSSPGPLFVRVADDKLTVEGTGFLWEQTNSFLRISNQGRQVYNGQVENFSMP